jgi:hypothetical protein
MKKAEQAVAEWLRFEAREVVLTAMELPPEQRSAYMRARIEAALRNAVEAGANPLTGCP